MIKGKELLRRFNGRQNLLILFLVGVLLMVIALPTDSTGWFGSASKEGDSSELRESGEMNESGESAAKEASNYEAYLEQKIAETLALVNGVGKVEVMITLKSDGQKLVEKDHHSSSQVSAETDHSGGSRNVEDKSSDKISIYQQSADGGQIPYVSKQLKPEIEGVVVVAEGGGEAVVMQEISEAIQALLGVLPHKIKIMKMADT